MHLFFQHPNVGSCQSITMVHRVRGVSRGAAGGGLRGGGAGLNTTVAVLGTVTPTQHLTVQHSQDTHTSNQAGKLKVNIESKIQASASDLHHLSKLHMPQSAARQYQEPN